MSPTNAQPAFLLAPAVQNYAWGKDAQTSTVAYFAKATSALQEDDAKPYAEVGLMLCLSPHQARSSHYLPLPPPP